jgi:hypothetical protein
LSLSFAAAILTSFQKKNIALKKKKIRGQL